MMLQMLAQSVDSSNADSTYLVYGLILVAAAIVLFAIELFVPSGGLIGLLCGVAAIGSIVAFFVYDTLFGWVALGTYVVLTPLAIWLALKLWMSSPMARNIVLGHEDDEPEYDASPEAGAVAAERAQLDRVAALRALIGAEGVTVTALRPVGTIRISGQRIDALAESGVIDANTPIMVCDVYDNQVKVRPL